MYVYFKENYGWFLKLEIEKSTEEGNNQDRCDILIFWH